MQKKVLTEVDLYTGEISMPKGFEIDRDKIRNDIIESFVKKNRINTNPQAYAFDDYVVPYSQPLQWMQDYMRDHWRADYGHTLVLKDMHGKVLHPLEQSFLRHHVDPVDLRNSPDYTFIYVLDVEPNSCECIIEYDDNRRNVKKRSNEIENGKPSCKAKATKTSKCTPHGEIITRKQHAILCKC